MTKEAAEILRQAENEATSADEAWENIEELSRSVDWDVEQMLSAVDRD